MNQFVTSAVTVLLAVIGVAIIAVLVKQGNATASVIQAATGGFSSILSTAENPGSGGSGLTGGVLSGFNQPGGVIQAL